MRLARLPDRVPDRRSVLGVAEHLVPQLARVPGARDHDRDPLGSPDPAQPQNRNQRSSASEVWVGGGPDDFLQHVPALRPLHGQVVKLIG